MTLPLLDDWVFALFLVFARLGSALMILPGFGEPYVPSRTRLAFAVLLSIVVLPLVASRLPAPPANLTTAAGLILLEVGNGLLIGAVARMALAAVHIGGTMIAMQSGLAAAMFFDPSESGQSAVTGNFLMTVVLTLIFVTDMHHDLIRALVASYGVLPAGAFAGLVDGGMALARTATGAFEIGLRIAMPVMAASLIVLVILGMLNRLVPTFQAMFVAMPLQLFIALALLGLSVTTSSLVFFEWFEAVLAMWDGG